MRQIAVFGSAFNPPSLGHKSVIESLRHFDLVLLVPSIAHAWGKEMLDFSLRCQLVEAFILDLDMDNVTLSRVEAALKRPDESVTTYAVLKQLTQDYPDAELTFIIGPDNLLKFSQFYRAEEIVEQYSVLACPERVKVRSTDIRNHLRNGLPIDALTTPRVCQFLAQNPVFSQPS